MIIKQSLTEIYVEILKMLLDKGKESSPRGMKIKELLCFEFTITNPRSRILYSKERKMNIEFAMADFLWMISGQDNVEFIDKYNTQIKNYSDDGKVLQGAYGPRLFGKVGVNQIKYVYEQLKFDKDTRQAIMIIYSPELDSKVEGKSRDVPCTILLHFFLRENKLHLITYMRSNDIIKGVTYDIFNFTMIQEILATLLKVDLGFYVHIAGSMHLYETDFELAKKIVDEYPIKTIYEMPIMPKFIDYNEFEEIIKFLIRQEVRFGKKKEEEYTAQIEGMFQFADPLQMLYWIQFLQVLEVSFYRKKMKNEIGEKLADSFEAIQLIIKNLMPYLTDVLFSIKHEK